MLHSPTGGPPPEKPPRSESGGKRKPLGLSEHAAAGVETQAPLGKATKLPRSEQLRSTSRLPPDARGPQAKVQHLSPNGYGCFSCLHAAKSRSMPTPRHRCASYFEKTEGSKMRPGRCTVVSLLYWNTSNQQTRPHRCSPGPPSFLGLGRM